MSLPVVFMSLMFLHRPPALTVDLTHPLNLNSKKLRSPKNWYGGTGQKLVKWHGQTADDIILGDTFTRDGFSRAPTDSVGLSYMLANPPFGVEWKQQKQHIEQECDILGYYGRFGAGLPRITDGSVAVLTAHALEDATC